MGNWTGILALLFIFTINPKPPSETIKTLHVPDPILCEYEKVFNKNANGVDSLSSFVLKKSSCGSSVSTFFVIALAVLVGVAIAIFLFRHEVSKALMLSGLVILIPLGPSLASTMAEAAGVKDNDKRTMLQKLIDDHQWEKAVDFVDTLGVTVSQTQKAYLKAQVFFLESKPDQAKIFTQEVFNDINNSKLMAKPEVMYVLEKSAFGAPKSQIALSVAK